MRFHERIHIFQSIQIWLKSQKGPIEVFLCPEEITDMDNSNDSCPSDSGGTTESTSSDVGSAKKSVSVGSCGEESCFSEDSVSCDSFKGKAVLMQQELMMAGDLNVNKL